MRAQCTPAQLCFEGLGRRVVSGRFDGGRLSPDGGGILLREVDLRLGLLARLAGCFTDYRTPASVEHGVRALVAQRIYGLALGYEDLNDHGALRQDALLALLVGTPDPTGSQRVRSRDRGVPLASASTLNRLELGRPETARASRYHRIVADPAALDALLVDLFAEAHAVPPEEIWLDLDATDDPLHGHQEGRFFHGYRTYCYLPLYIFCGEHLLCARLRPANLDASAGSIDELARIVGALRRRWPEVRIGIRVLPRGDPGVVRAARGRVRAGSRPQRASGARPRDGAAGGAGRAPCDRPGGAVLLRPALPHAPVLEPDPPGGRQGGGARPGGQPTLRGDQPERGRGARPGAVRAPVLRPRPHQPASPAGVAATTRIARPALPPDLPADRRPAEGDARPRAGHPAGPPTGEGRSTPVSDGTSVQTAPAAAQMRAHRP